MQIHTVMQSAEVCITEDASLYEAHALMKFQGIQHLPVVRGSRLVGIVTERDIQRASVSTVPALACDEWPAQSESITIGDIMTQPAAVVTSKTTLQETARLMQVQRLDGIPIVEGHTLLGQVTNRELLNTLISMCERRQPTAFGEILVAIDFGASTSTAVATALAFGQQYGATLTVLHVIPRLWRDTGLQAEARSSTLSVVVHGERRRAVVEQVISLLPRNQVEQVICEVIAGDPAAMIAEAASRLGADLIVMGRKRQGWLGRRLWPSVTEKVIRQGPCPVLAV